MNIRFACLGLVAAFAACALADDLAEVVSADGQTVTKYATMEAAVGGLTEDGCTVRLLGDSTNTEKRAPIVRSCTIDLQGHTWKGFGNDHAILVSAGQTVTISNGCVRGVLCLFHLDGNSKLYLYDCEILTERLVYCDNETAEIHLKSGTLFRSDCFTSAWGSGNLRIHIWDGAFCSFSIWTDCNNVSEIDPQTPRLQVHGGSFGLDPTAAIVDSGTFVLAEKVTKHFPILNQNHSAYFTVGSESDAAAKARYDAAEAQLGAARAPALTNAFVVANEIDANGMARRRVYNGATVTLLKDVGVNTGLTFPDKVSVTNTLDLGGHELTMNNGSGITIKGCLKLTNGTVSNSKASWATDFFLTGDGSRFFADATVTFSASQNFAFVLGSNNAQAYLEGTKVGCRLFTAWNKTGYANTFIRVSGDAEFTGDVIAGDTYSTTYLDVRGGDWNLNPTTWLGEGCVFYSKASKPSCYCVADFAKQCYNLTTETDVHVFPAAVPAVSGPIEMTVKGTLPALPKEIADYSAVANYRSLSFTLVSETPGTLIYRGGKLSVVAGKMPNVWVGGSTFGSNWSDGENWTTGNMPAPGECVLVSNTTAGAVITLDVPVTVKNLTVDGTQAVTLRGDETLTLTSSTTFSETTTGHECLTNFIPVTIDAPVAFTGAAGCGFYNRASAKNANGYGLEFVRKVTIAGTKFVCSTEESKRNATCFQDEVEGPSAILYDQYQKNYQLDFNGKVTCASLHFSVWTGATVNFRAAGNSFAFIDAGNIGKVYFRAAGAFPATAFIEDGYDTSFAGYHFVNFCNFDATVNRFVTMAGCLSKKPYDPSQENNHGSIRSFGSFESDARPITLTLANSANAISDTRIMDAISLVYDPTDASVRQTLTNRVHSTTGSLTVRKGTLRLTGQISFPNVPAVTVESGCLELLSTRNAAFGSLKSLTLGDGARFKVAATATNPLGIMAVASLHPNAKLELEADASVTLAAVRTGTVYVADATYTGVADVPGTVYAPWIEGAGTVVVNSEKVSVWRGTTGGRWGDAANWTTPLGGAKVEAVRIDNPSAADLMVTIDAATALPKTLLVENAGAGRTVLSVDADVTAAGSTIDIGAGARLVVADGRRFFYDGTSATGTEPVRIHDGGVFRVDGGEAVFTNYTGLMRVFGTTSATGRVEVAEGSFLMAPKNASSHLTVGEGGLFAVTNGTMTFVTQPNANAFIHEGGRIDCSGDSQVIGLATVAGNQAIWRVFDGETVLSGRTAYLHNGEGRDNFDNFYVQSFKSAGCAHLVVRDEASMSGFYDWFNVGAGDNPGSRAIFEVDTTGALGTTRMLACIIAVGCSAYELSSSDGEMILRNGTVKAGNRGVYVGWHGNYNGNKTVGTTATGTLLVSGGSLQIDGNCWDGNNGSHLSPNGGLLAGIGMQGTQRTGLVELSGGEIVNTHGSLLLGMSSTGVGRFVQTGGSYEGQKGGNRKVVVGAGGGTGEFVISNGTFAAEGSGWVGGVLTNEFVFTASGTSAYTWKDHGYTADRHDAKGTFVFAGGTFSLAQPLVVGADGEGTVLRYGSQGTMTVDGLVLSNATKSVVRFVADANGTKPIRVTNALRITDGAELEVDLSAYTGTRYSFPLFTYGSLNGAFDPDKVRVTLAPGMPNDMRLVTSEGRIRLAHPTGSVVIFR